MPFAELNTKANANAHASSPDPKRIVVPPPKREPTAPTAPPSHPGADNPTLRPPGIAKVSGLKRKRMSVTERRTKAALSQDVAVAGPDSTAPPTPVPFAPDTTFHIRRTTKRADLLPGEVVWLNGQIRNYVNRYRPPVSAISDVAAALATRFGVTEDLIWPGLNECRAYMPPATRLQDYQRSQIVASALGADRASVLGQLHNLMHAEKPMVVTVYMNEDGTESPGPTDFDQVGHQKIDYVPDTAMQFKAAAKLADLHGASTPSQVNHEIGLDEGLQAVTEQGLKIEMAKLMLELKEQGIDERLLDEITPVGSDTLDGTKLIGPA